VGTHIIVPRFIYGFQTGESQTIQHTHKKKKKEKRVPSSSKDVKL